MPFKNVIFTPWSNLVDLPTHLCYYRDHRSNRNIQSNWSEGLLIINSIYLWETSSHKLSFVLLNAAICSILDLVEPSRSHHWLSPQVSTLSPKHYSSWWKHIFPPWHPSKPVTCCLLIAKRLSLNNATDYNQIATKPLCVLLSLTYHSGFPIDLGLPLRYHEAILASSSQSSVLYWGANILLWSLYP